MVSKEVFNTGGEGINVFRKTKLRNMPRHEAKKCENMPLAKNLEKPSKKAERGFPFDVGY